MKPSHHLLRRTARAKKQRLDRLVKVATYSTDPPTQLRAQEALARLGIDLSPKPVFVVERAERGPWRWRVEQLD